MIGLLKYCKNGLNLSQSRTTHRKAWVNQSVGIVEPVTADPYLAKKRSIHQAHGTAMMSIVSSIVCRMWTKPSSAPVCSPWCAAFSVAKWASLTGTHKMISALEIKYKAFDGAFFWQWEKILWHFVGIASMITLQHHIIFTHAFDGKSHTRFSFSWTKFELSTMHQMREICKNSQ